MARVVPTILAADPEDYARRINNVEEFADRVHVDIADGVFASNKTIGPSQVYVPDGCELDVHLMVEHPEANFETILSLNPSLIIFHFESQGDIRELMHQACEVGIKVGLALKPDTTIEQVQELLPDVDHLMIFTGTLGQNGGEFHAEGLDKIAAAKEIKPGLEAGADGGINETNIHIALERGADVLNVGSAIHDAPDPQKAFERLSQLAAGEAV